jgi:hypothetical protein
MSWRTAATALVVVFAIAMAQAVLIGPVLQVTSDLNDTGDYSDLEGADDDYNGNEVISSLPGQWLNMGLVAMFGIMAWGIARVVRRELTRNRL